MLINYYVKSLNFGGSQIVYVDFHLGFGVPKPHMILGSTI